MRRESWRMLEEESQNLQPFIPGPFGWISSLAFSRKRAFIWWMKLIDSKKVLLLFIFTLLRYKFYIVSSFIYYIIKKNYHYYNFLLLYKHYHYRILKSCVMIWRICNSSIETQESWVSFFLAWFLIHNIFLVFLVWFSGTVLLVLFSGVSNPTACCYGNR